jgi:3-hydroxyisobutyrate dehydrogenase
MLKHLRLPSSIQQGCRAFSASKAWPSVAIVGIGQLGAAVATNLLRNDVELTLFDIAGDKNIPVELRDKLGGASWASSAKDAASRADVVITALPRPEHVTAAFHGTNGEDGILAGLRSGATWIEHSTTDFENTAIVREQVEAKGAFAVEAPLTGGMQILREGKMVTLVGAAPEVLEGQIAELIALSAPRIVRCGEFGHATVIKIFSNILCAAHDVAVGETLCTAKKAGLDMQLVFDAMRISSGNSFCWETEVPRMLKGDYYPDFTAEMMHKDISLGLALGERYGVPMPMNRLIARRYEEAMDKFGRDSGSSIPCRLVEEESQCRLIDGEGSDDIYPGNSLAPDSHGGAFKDWSYTSELSGGSYTIMHTGYSNCYTQPPFTTYASAFQTPEAKELEALRLRVAELEEKIASLEEK